MKNNLLNKVLLTIILACLGIDSMWAGDGNYAALKAVVAPSGTGKVYVASASASDNIAAEDASSYDTTSSDNSGEGKSTARYFTAYAKPNRGSIFEKWDGPYEFTGSDNNGNNTNKGIVTGFHEKSNPIQISVTSPSNGSTGFFGIGGSRKTHIAEVKANFVNNPNYANIQFLALDEEVRSGCRYKVNSDMAPGVSPNNTTSWTIQNSNTPITMFDNENFTLTAEVTARGYGFVQWFVETADERYTLPGGMGETNPATVSYVQLNQVVQAGGSVGAEFKKKASTNISYLAATYREGNTPGTSCNYTASGADANGLSYPTITIGGGAVTTYEDDQITLTATAQTGYALYRYYYVDQNDNKRLLGVLFTATQTVTIPMDAKAVGAEFVEMRYKDIIYQEATGGTYTVNAKTTGSTGPEDFSLTITTADQTKNTLVSAPVTLTATPASGKMLYRWYAEDENGIKSTIGELFTTPQSVGIPLTATKVGAEFVDIKPFMVVGEGLYGNLSDALQAASVSTSKLIKVIQNTTVASGYYTIPSDVTLLIPKNADQLSPTASIERLKTTTTPSLYRKLTLADGVTLNVSGTIEVSGTQSAGAQGANGAGIPTGPYGQLALCPGSKVILNNNAKLYAWGFVTGDGTKDSDGNYLSGEIDARRGSTVYEQFQMYDWKGGWGTSKMLSNSHKTFPITQYFIQNVEAPVKYHPGSSLIGQTSIQVKKSLLSDETQIVNSDAISIVGVEGSIAMFLMSDEADAENTWVRKEYDAKNDRQVYKVNSGAKLGSMKVGMTNVPILGNLSFNSQDYVLPITNNLKIELLTGYMDITQNTVLLPGAEIEVDKEATVTIVDEPTKSYDGALYLIGKDEWRTGNYVFSGTAAQQVLYTAAHGKKPGIRNLSSASWNQDATLFVHGTFDMQGVVYTTASGANICSSIEDAGTFSVSNAVGSSSSTVGVFSGLSGSNISTSISYQDFSTPPALLRNDAGSKYSSEDGFSETAGTLAGQSFCFMDIDGDDKGEWVSLTIDNPDYCFVYDQYGTYYIKPGAYVAVNATKGEDGYMVGNPDYTFSDAAGEGRLFINAGCQWWEVTLTDNNLYYCEDNGIYYYHDGDVWVEKRFEIQWKNYDGMIIDTYDLPYGETPTYLGTTPIRPEDIDYTYSFQGWSPAVQAVTGDATYLATYQATQKKYTIRFLNEDDGEIERHQLARGETPICTSAPQKAGKYLVWEPTIAVVTGNAVYRATYLDSEPTEFTISWRNYNGVEIYHETVDAGDTPAYSKTTAIGHTGVDADGTPVKDLGNEYNYTFTGWTPAIAEATVNAAYTATFDVAKKKGAITFIDVNGNPIGAVQYIDYGQTPTAPDYTKENPEAGHIYTLVWTPSIQTVTGNATYQASFTDEVQKVTITTETTLANSGVISGAGTYDYNANANALTVSVTPNAGYSFIKWQTKQNDNYIDLDHPQSFTTAVTENKTYRAVMEKQADLIVNVDDVTDVKTPLEVHNLILTANATESGQLLHADRLTISGDIFYDLTLNTWARHWHAFGVPWTVDIDETPLTEVKTKAGVETSRVLTMGRDYDILYYDGAVRAQYGPVPACWKYVNDEAHVLIPGRVYMIAFTSPVGTLRFAKKAGTSLLFSETLSVAKNTESTGNTMDGGWNGIANPMTYHAVLNAGVTECQVYDSDTIGSDNYSLVDLADKKFIVGKAVYVQVQNTQNVGISQATTQSPFAAPRRQQVADETDNRYDVHIAPLDGESTDHIYVVTDENKEEDTYTIVADLAKLGMSTRKAHIWVNRYETRLAKNTIAPIDGQANYPLGLYAPNDGEYTISLTYDPDDDQTMYLTLDGEAIWNLSESPYTLTLNKGIVNNYGLRIRAHAPQVITGIDEAILDAQGKTRKVLIKNNVFIIRGENVYTIDGQIVK